MRHWISGYVWLLPWKKMHIDRKRQPFFIAYCISSLLQSGISARYSSLHHPQISHLSLPSHSHISNLHLPMSWARSAAPSTDWVPPASTASEAAGQHGATGTHRNKLLLTGRLKVTPFVEWWLKLSSAKSFPTQGAENYSFPLKVTLSPWSEGSFGLSGHQLQCWTILTMKKFY